MKILIITNKIKTITIISNFLTLYIKSNISLLIANDLESGIQIIHKHNIETIIFENDIFNLSFYYKNLSYIPIILINDVYNYDKATIKHFNCISLDNLSCLQVVLNKYIDLSNTLQDSKIKILKELIYLGFNVKHKGTKYIMDSITILKCYYSTNNITDVYSIIAKKYNTNIHNIKTNILTAVNYMYCETEFLKLKKYFSLNEEKKPTPKNIILTILTNI